ncbi:MAG: hypothetical protein J6Y20_07670, partial [Lachnospiraceae bacterium]|nr:hypothetical protein [Lachnospiraceae bacterium]
MPFSRNPRTGNIESYTENGFFTGFVSTMGDFIAEQMAEDGGPGSGNFGHAGRPGKVGGSATEEELDPIGAEETSSKTEIEYLERKIKKTSRFGAEGRARQELQYVLERLKAREYAKEHPASQTKAGKTVFSSPPESVKTLKGFAEKSEKNNVGVLRNLGIPQEKIDKATDVMAEVLNVNKFGMFIDPDVFLEEVVSSHFKNQFETGTSMGILDESVRRKASSELYGAPEDLSPKDYEKYGALVKNETGDGCSSGYGYGGLVVTFKKDRLAGKVTYTLTDSLAVVDPDFGVGMMAGSASVEKTTIGGCIDPNYIIETLANYPIND